jgi:hypothetical protein
MRATLTELGVGLTLGAVAILFTIVVPYHKARAKYRKEFNI